MKISKIKKFCSVQSVVSIVYFKTLYVLEFKVCHKVSYFNTLCEDKVFFSRNFYENL